ncbi:MAPEG family protein [Vibrio penaeicida]|uniref:MAPEG family protein n=1 Tax=Vibrio penaeicida TaxID=104609 RepID=UPI000CE9CA8D|nr:MAPEG family protein [Vibrio penaeicida]
MIIGIYLSILSIIFIILSAQTIVTRRKEKVAVGAGDSKKLLRVSRAHANFAEYVPITVILLLTIEYLGGLDMYLHFAGTILVIGRMVHAYGISQVRENFNYRVFGMVSTLTCIGLSALYLLFLSITNSVS